MTNVDGRGVMRGCCNVQGCSCFAYDGTISGGGKCDTCHHPPGKHANSSMMSTAQPPPPDPASDDKSLISTFILSQTRSFSSPTGDRRQQQRQQPPRPVPRMAWDAAAPPQPPLQTCAYPNCTDLPYFDLNTGDSSDYCKLHVHASRSPQPPSFMADGALAAQFGHAMDGVMPLSMHPSHHGFLAQDGMSIHPYPQPLPNAGHFPPHQLHTNPPNFLHVSQSTPNLSPLPQALPQPVVPLLPDHERCKLPQCNKKRFREPNGRIHDFCRRTHAEEYTKRTGGVSPENKCRTRGCSRERRAREDGNGYYDYCGKRCRDGKFRTAPVGPGETCNFPGCKRQKYVDPANNRVHDYCGRTHANQAAASGIVPQACTLQQLSSSELSQVQSYFSSQWCSKKGTCPTITCAFKIVNPQLEARWNAYKPRLPSDCQTVEKHYHGTKLKCDIVNAQSPCNDEDCGICGISKYGVDRRCIQKNINFQRFGHGFYFAPNSSKCHDYTQGAQTHRAMLLVEILPGKKHTIYNNDVQLKKPQDGYHSVYGKPGQALNYAELVVYNPDCVMPRYIILYKHNGVHKIAK